MEKNQGGLAWTTWEELLLTSAVKRYGVGDWSTVAVELQSRASSLPIHLLTAQICQNKFHDLKRRFTERDDDGGGGGDAVVDDGADGGEDSVPWLEDLRKLRMAELRDVVRGSNLSIQSLNSKVKRLEEERERSMREDNENGDRKPDLEKESGEERSENDKNHVAGGIPTPAEDAGRVSVSGERSERDNQSINESNSTENRKTGEKVQEKEPDPVQTSLENEEPETKTVQADSWNDSSKPSEDKKASVESAELRDSAAAESKEGTKDSSDVQSTASLTKKSGGGGGEDPVVSKATVREDSGKKSEPLIGLLEMIRSHKYGSVFEIRLESQKTEKYKAIIRQHVDLEILQTRIENGSYSSCTNKFYLDLLVLCNNAIVFFPKASAESAAAFELRKLVLKDLKKKRSGRQPDPKPELDPETGPDPVVLKPKPDPDRSDPLLAKHKSSAPFVACRKRSSISTKPSTSNKTEKLPDVKPAVNPKQAVKSSSNEDESSIKLKLKEKPVTTGARSMRRSSNTRTNGTTTTTTKNPITNSSSSNPGSKGEAPKVEKKKSEALDIVKKRGAADFLKRIKNSPAKGSLLETLKSSSTDDSHGSSKRETRDQQKKRVDDRKEVTTRQKSGGGGGGGKKVKEEVSPSKRSVGRPPKRGREVTPVKRGKESGEREVAAKRPSKRSKR